MYDLIEEDSTKETYIRVLQNNDQKYLIPIKNIKEDNIVDEVVNNTNTKKKFERYKFLLAISKGKNNSKYNDYDIKSKNNTKNNNKE